jgi:hypothetical protein
MKFSLYKEFGAKNSPVVFDAVASGLRKHGHQVVAHDDAADVAVIWSQLWAGRMFANQKVWDLFHAYNKPVLVLEVGALHRGHTWRIMLNGKNQFLTTGNDSTRSNQLGLTMQDWANQGEDVVIALQRSDSQQWAGELPLENWLQSTVETLQKYTSRKIVVRPHPRFPVKQLPSGCQLQMPIHVPNTYDCYDFDRSLSNAWAVVNHNSNPGPVAVLNGVPAFVGKSSLAAPVANLNLADIEKPLRPNRTQWFNDLAHTEWLVDEIKSGQALYPVLSKLQ